MPLTYFIEVLSTHDRVGCGFKCDMTLYKLYKGERLIKITISSIKASSISYKCVYVIFPGFITVAEWYDNSNNNSEVLLGAIIHRSDAPQN